MRKKKWPSRKAYLQQYNKRYNKMYRLKNREKLNEMNKLLRRRKKGSFPREVWIELQRDRVVWKALHSGMPSKNPQAWRELLRQRAEFIDPAVITDKCVDCEILFSEVTRCSRNPDYCRGCWSSRYLKKIARNKKSPLYNPKMV